MRKYWILALCLAPLIANAGNPLKEAVKANRNYQAEKQQINHRINKTKHTLKQVSDGTYVDEKVEQKVNQASSKYTQKLNNAKKRTDPKQLKRKANSKIKQEKRKAVDKWLYED